MTLVLGGRGRPPHEIVARTPPDDVVAALLANLRALIREACGADVSVRLDYHLAPPGGTGARDGHPTPETDSSAAVVIVPDVGCIRFDPRPPNASSWDAAARDSANWIAACTHAARARSVVEVAGSEAVDAGRRLHESDRLIRRVREIERHRLAHVTTTTTLPRIARIETMLVGGGVPDWEALNAATDELIDCLRTAVRGVFPAMLPDRGVTETLSELAATLPCDVHLNGGLGLRTGWEVETGFYHAVAAAISAVSDVCGGRPIEVRLARTECLVADVRAPLADGGPALLDRRLSIDQERIRAVGGQLDVSADRSADRSGADGVVVRVRLPDRTHRPRRAMSAAELDRCVMHRRVARALPRCGLDDAVIASLRADLAAEVRVLVVQMPAPDAVSGLHVMSTETAPDAELAREVRDIEGAWGRVDAVVCGRRPTAEFQALLREGPILFGEHVTVSQAFGFLRARAPAIAAMRVIERLRRLAEGANSGALHRVVEELRIGGQEFAEARLLEAVVRETAPEVVDVGAARLLGACGEEPRSRLGLAADATDAEVRAAAAEEVRRWSTTAARPMLDRTAREAAGVLRRCAEGLTVPASIDLSGRSAARTASGLRDGGSVAHRPA